MEGKRCASDSMPWALWQLVYQKLGSKEDRRNFAHTCKNVHDAVLQEITSLELCLGDGVYTCLRALECFPKPLLPDVAGARLTKLVISNQRSLSGPLRRIPRLLDLMQALDGSTAALQLLQNVESLTLKGLDTETHLLGQSIRSACPRLKTMKLERVSLSGAFWGTLAPLAITAVHLSYCEGADIICGLSTLKSLKDIVIAGPWTEDIGALSHCPKLTNLRVEDRALAQYAPSPGLASVLQACPITILQVPDFAMLPGCGSASVRTIMVSMMKMHEPHGDARDFRAKFPALQECNLGTLFLFNSCLRSEAAGLAERVRQSAFLLAALASSGVQFQAGYIGPHRLLSLRGSFVRPSFEVDHVLLSALSPLSGIAGFKHVRDLGFACLAISDVVMQNLASVFRGVSRLTLYKCSIPESGLAVALGQLPALSRVDLYGNQSITPESTARALVTACAAAQARRSLRFVLLHRSGEEDVRSVYTSWKARCDAVLAALPGPRTVSCEVKAL